MPDDNDINKLLIRRTVSDRMTEKDYPVRPETAMVKGIAKGSNATLTGVYGFSEKGIAIYGESSVYAGFFGGDVNITGELTVYKGHTNLEDVTAGNIKVTGDIQGSAKTTITCFDVRLVGSDCAENFDIAGATAVDPGTVMVIDNEGALKPCQDSYDKKVTGVISGAGKYKPGLILGQENQLNNRQPIALLGKVYCKVDAQFGAIEVGDMLTTSPVLGHAMRAADPLKAFGAVLGKALRPLKEGQGLIPILIALQ